MPQPKDEVFRTVTCEKLIVKQFAGRNKVEISSDSKSGYIAVYNHLGHIVVEIGIDQHGNGRVLEYP